MVKICKGGEHKQAFITNKKWACMQEYKWNMVYGDFKHVFITLSCRQHYKILGIHIIRKDCAFNVPQHVPS